MGILSRSLGIQALSVEDPSQPLLPGSVMMETLGLGRSDAGVLVNEAQAMRITTAQAWVKIISEDLSSNAHEIFQQMPDASMRLATDHRLWPIIHDQPNPNMSASVFWGAFVAAAIGWGNGYAWIKRDRAARVVSLVPLGSGRTSPVRVQRAADVCHDSNGYRRGGLYRSGEHAARDGRQFRRHHRHEPNPDLQERLAWRRRQRNSAPSSLAMGLGPAEY